MKDNQHIRDTMKIVGVVAILASLLLVITAMANAQEVDSAAGDEIAAEQAAPDTNIGAASNPGKEARLRRKAMLRALREARRQERREYVQQQRAAQLAASQNKASQPNALRPAGTLMEIQVSFKLDPRLTRSLYMGDRWVSSATYVGTVGQKTVEAKVMGIDANGKAIAISPNWIPTDPEMVTVSPIGGNVVLINVHRAGVSQVKMESAGLSRFLTIKATESKNNVIQVEISRNRERSASATPQMLHSRN